MFTCNYTPDFVIFSCYQIKMTVVECVFVFHLRGRTGCLSCFQRLKNRKGSATRLSKKNKKFPKRESWFVSCSRDNLNIISLYFRAPVPSCVDKATGVAMQNLGFKTAGSPDGALNACYDARGVPSRPLTVKDRDTTHTTAKRTAVTTPLTQ